MSRAVSLLVAAVLSLAFAPAPPYRPKPDPGKEDLKKMQGTWAVARRSVAGSVSRTDGQDMTVVIEGDRIRFLVKGEVRTEWAITLDPTKSPKVLDRTLVPGKGTVKTANGTPIVHRGIYLLDGDTLRLSHSLTQGSQARPSDFEGSGRNENMYVLKRLKP